MSHRFKLVIAGAAALAMPGIAQADTASSEIELSSTVLSACQLGTPDVTEINLLDLTGPDGKLSAAKTQDVTQGTAVIANAWCNGPHTLSMRTWPMALTRQISYGQPANMARKVTYTARLIGMSDAPLGGRPAFGGDLAFVDNPGARAAGSSGLRLNISKLQTLTAANQEQAGLMLEYGEYRGTVTITLAAGS